VLQAFFIPRSALVSDFHKINCQNKGRNSSY
jgi:hypothetical protein